MKGAGLDIDEAIRGELHMVRGLGGDPVVFMQERFNRVWDKMPHVLTPLSNKIRSDVNAGIADFVNQLLSE